MPGAFHRARPAAERHEAVGPSSTRLRHTGHRTVSGAVAHIADRFTRNRSFSARFNEVACGLGSTTPRVADSLPSDGGNCIIRDLTRRRHAASQLLMLQNPPHPPTWTAPRCRQDLGAAPAGTKKLAQREPHGGISDTKLALCVQNCPIWRILLLLGEFCPAFVANKPSRANFLPHQPRPITGKKETTPQHNTPSRAVKHLPPQHATNNPKSPIFTTHGRTFFHNTHHPHNTHPHQGELSFNHRRQDQAKQQSHAIPTQPNPTPT